MAGGRDHGDGERGAVCAKAGQQECHQMDHDSDLRRVGQGEGEGYRPEMRVAHRPEVAGVAGPEIGNVERGFMLERHPRLRPQDDEYPRNQDHHLKQGENGDRACQPPLATQRHQGRRHGEAGGAGTIECETDGQPPRCRSNQSARVIESAVPLVQAQPNAITMAATCSCQGAVARLNRKAPLPRITTPPPSTVRGPSRVKTACRRVTRMAPAR